MRIRMYWNRLGRCYGAQGTERSLPYPGSKGFSYRFSACREHRRPPPEVRRRGFLSCGLESRLQRP